MTGRSFSTPVPRGWLRRDVCSFPDCCGDRSLHPSNRTRSWISILCLSRILYLGTRVYFQGLILCGLPTDELPLFVGFWLPRWSVHRIQRKESPGLLPRFQWNQLTAYAYQPPCPCCSGSNRDRFDWIPARVACWHPCWSEPRWQEKRYLRMKYRNRRWKHQLPANGLGSHHRGRDLSFFHPVVMPEYPWNLMVVGVP